MPETRGKPHPTPHPTPNPDHPRGPELIRPGGPVPARTPHSTPRPDLDPDESDYDSVHDDLNQVLSQPVSEPDPALGSGSPGEPASLPPREDTPIPSFLREKGKQPKTAEIFKAIVPPGQAAVLPGDSGRSLLDPLVSSTPVPEEVFGRLEQGLSRDRSGDPDSRSDDDDQLAESRSTWFFVLLMSYSSAITLALVWVLWSGRSLKSPDSPAANISQGTEEQGSKPPEPTASEPLPPIPSANITTLGKTIRIGEIDVTPLEIDLTPVELVRSIDPEDYRREESGSLMLKLRLTNVSGDHQFAPLDRLLIRGQNSPLDRSYIASSGPGKIRLFPLALDSEWAILGQSFPVLKSGESVETLVASEPVTEDRLQGELTWRIRLRVGPYRTDVLGVRFTRSNLPSHECRLEFEPRGHDTARGRRLAGSRTDLRIASAGRKRLCLKAALPESGTTVIGDLALGSPVGFCLELLDQIGDPGLPGRQPVVE